MEYSSWCVSTGGLASIRTLRRSPRPSDPVGGERFLRELPLESSAPESTATLPRVGGSTAVGEGAGREGGVGTAGVCVGGGTREGCCPNCRKAPSTCVRRSVTWLCCESFTGCSTSSVSGCAGSSGSEPRSRSSSVISSSDPTGVGGSERRGDRVGLALGALPIRATCAGTAW